MGASSRRCTTDRSISARNTPVGKSLNHPGSCGASTEPGDIHGYRDIEALIEELNTNDVVYDTLEHAT